MSVNREDYIVVGADIGIDFYNSELYDEYEKYYRADQVGEMTMINDNYSGEYFVVGEIVAYGDEYDGFKVTELHLSEKTDERVADFIYEKFGIKVTPKLIAVTNFY